MQTLLRRVQQLEARAFAGGPVLQLWELRPDGRAVTVWDGQEYTQRGDETQDCFLARLAAAVPRPVIWVSEQDQQL